MTEAVSASQHPAGQGLPPAGIELRGLEGDSDREVYTESAE